MSELKLKLKPFSVPNYVMVEMPISKRQEGFKEGTAFPLSDLDEETLIDMCDEFRANVFLKARSENKEDL